MAKWLLCRNSQLVVKFLQTKVYVDLSMCGKRALVTNIVVAKSYTILLVLFIFMELCVVKHPVSSSCQHVGFMELISMFSVPPLTCALLEEIVEGPCIWQVILFLYLHRAILRSQGTGGEKYDYFIGICTNPNPQLVADDKCMVIQLNSTDPSKSTGTCLGTKNGAQLTDTLSKCLSTHVCHDLHVCRSPPTPCALQAMDLPSQSGLYRGQWALSYSNLANCM